VAWQRWLNRPNLLLLLLLLHKQRINQCLRRISVCVLLLLLLQLQNAAGCVPFPGGNVSSSTICSSTRGACWDL
jgi:hypothetical protein